MRHKSEPGMLLDIASYARQGPGTRDRLSPKEIEHISLTVRRAPEVMVKVLTRGGQDLKSIQRHLAYLSRKGELEIETDEGERVAGKGVEKELLEDWDLDLQENRRRADLGPRKDRVPPKLVHKILFSMPPGTPQKKVLEAVKDFAREEFGLKHRYVMVLHTDEPHPHVHLLVKAMSEQGARLNIRKATLREWRREFVRHLREQGIAANATERAVRGETRIGKRDGIYRAALRGDSTHIQNLTYTVASDLRRGDIIVEGGKSTLRATRRRVEEGWHALSEILDAEGYLALATEVRRFLLDMPSPRSERESIAAALMFRSRDNSREHAITR
jgi:hypothetical protein